MPKNQIMFYATAPDLIGVLTKLERARPLQYTRTGMFDVERPQAYPSCSAIPDFGRAIHPTAVANPTYLVSTAGHEIHVRKVPQQAGGILFAIDQMANPDTIALSPGGRFGNDVILYGKIGTVSQSPISKDLYAFIGR